MKQLRQNPDTGKWFIYDPELDEADCYIAVTNRSQFTVATTAQEAEEFIVSNNDGGAIYAITHYEHNDETLPRSKLYKEVHVNV